ncbi:MAG: hypothetical protein ACSLFP_06935 [Acidimicrobiales bacterium]
MSRRVCLNLIGASALLAMATIVPGLAPAAAQTGPSITLDRSEAAPGSPLLVTFEGFESPFVDIVLCGNLAYRGSTDCNMTAGVSKETLSGGRPKLVELIAHPPPTHCPCIGRATASSGDAFAVAPLVITGHPVDELVGVPEGPLVQVEVEAMRADQGVWASLRSMLGGRTEFETTVAVRNNTTETLSRLALSGSVGHWTDDDAVVLDLEPPAALEPGQTWTEDVVAEVTAPSFGTYQFEVVASGAGASVTETAEVAHRPWLLYLFAVVLVVDLVVMVGRWFLRWAARDEGQVYDDDDGCDVIGLTPSPSEPQPVSV